MGLEFLELQVLLGLVLGLRLLTVCELIVDCLMARCNPYSQTGSEVVDVPSAIQMLSAAYPVDVNDFRDMYKMTVPGALLSA